MVILCLTIDKTGSVVECVYILSGGKHKPDSSLEQSDVDCLVCDIESFIFFFFFPTDLEMQCWKVSVKFLTWKDQESIVSS